MLVDNFAHDIQLTQDSPQAWHTNVPHECREPSTAAESGSSQAQLLPLSCCKEDTNLAQQEICKAEVNTSTMLSQSHAVIKGIPDRCTKVDIHSSQVHRAKSVLVICAVDASGNQRPHCQLQAVLVVADKVVCPDPTTTMRVLDQLLQSVPNIRL